MTSIQHKVCEMAQLILSTDGEIVDTYPIETDVVTIGRHEDNDIFIDCMSVSGFHARVVRVGEAFFVEDLNSTNHTFVNADQISQSALRDGDVMTVGAHNLKFEVSDEESASPGSPARNGDPAAKLIVKGQPDKNPIQINGGMVTFGKTGEHVAAITRRGGQYYCLHVDGGESQQETLLNGSPVPNGGQPLKPHDVVKVAGIEMEFIQ